MRKLTTLSFVAVFVAPQFALAADIPNIKAGLWEVESVVDGEEQGKMKQCLDAETTKKMLAAGQKMMGGNCSDVKNTREGDTFTSSVECKIAGSTMESTTVMKGDYDKQYTAETRTKFSPPMMGQESSLAKSTGTWTGPCESGMKPGDTILPDGQRMNMLEMAEAMPDLGNMLEGLGRLGQPGPDGVSAEQMQQQLQQIQKQMEAVQQNK